MTLSNDQRSEINSPESYQISLLEEKLQVARRKQKVGEVVIRKQVETRMISIPIRREKLIVERIGENPEQLTEVIVAEETVNGFKYNELDINNSLSVNTSQFLSLASAEKLLTDIKQLSSTANTKIRVTIATNCSDLETLLELKKICDRYQ
ncbi:hypothetical protein C7B62_15505 [Pleurocapsa sp. CCALA 161]|uniref:DUF2382 domain-containing protein n=1 Tax=Pleurocapsa sp. CCALA 161 TaxID=2107688 RepID=UPI000D060B3B|nr:DUF2382 domain-containing protein [Pleurocapsa sp. CCALA 161]PSB08769.1 hypothetical protein C7B62_15505 [Pleurocapsa sp. CCALA 161]